MSESPAKPTVTIKKYANRRLYNTATSSYVTLENLSAMVKEGTEFNVYDAKTGEDITRSVLTQIIVEEEGKSGQQNLLPISFLRQLIGFYGDNMQWMVPKYLEYSMETLAKNQEQMRGYFQNAFGSMFPFSSTFEEMGKQNLAMFERAMRLFSPFPATSASPEPQDNPKGGFVGPNYAEASEEEASAPAPEKAAAAPEATAESSPSVTSINRRVETATSSVNMGAGSYARGGSVSPAYVVESPAPAAAPSVTPMPNVQQAAFSAAPSADDMQQKIANLQRQLADLAKSRG